MKIIESGHFDKIGGYNNKDNMRYSIQWELTHNCNNACSYCHIHNEKCYTDYVDMDKAMDIANTISKLDMIQNLTLIGGEPTLYPYFYEIFELLLSFNNMRNLTLFTNGSYDSDRLLSIIKSIKNTDKLGVFITYHAENSNVDDIINKIKSLIDNKICVYNIVMLEKPLLKQVREYLELVNAIKSQYLCCNVIPIVPVEQQGYSTDDLKLIKKNARRNKGDKSVVDNYIYYKIIKNGIVCEEMYDEFETKCLPGFYHNFASMMCYCYSSIRIVPNGMFASRCKRLEDKYYEFNLDNINKLSHRPVLCTDTYCYYNDDTRFVYKTTIDRVKHAIYNKKQQ